MRYERKINLLKGLLHHSILFVFTFGIGTALGFAGLQGLEIMNVFPDHSLGEDMSIMKYWFILVLPCTAIMHLIFWISLRWAFKKHKVVKTEEHTFIQEKDRSKKYTLDTKGTARWLAKSEMLLNTLPILETEIKLADVNGFITDSYLIRKSEEKKISSMLDKFKGLKGKKKEIYADTLAKAISDAHYKIQRNGEGEFQPEKFKAEDAVRLYYVDPKELHQTIIGSTGSGKTQGLIFPNMDVISKSHNQGSMVISDVKGELFAAKSKFLQSRGYKVKVLNFRDFDQSSTWNPLKVITDLWVEATKLYFFVENQNNEAKIKLDVESLNLEPDTLAKINAAKENIASRNKETDNNVNLLEAIGNIEAKLEDQMERGIRELATTIFITGDAKNAYWEDSARDIFLAIAWLYYEKYRHYETIRLKDKFKIEVLSDEIRDKYFNPESGLAVKTSQIHIGGIAKFGTESFDYQKNIFYSNKEVCYRAYELSKGALEAKTPGERYSGFLSKMSVFAQATIRAITSANNLDLSLIENEPTAIFILIPDEIESYNFFASLFVKQLYQKLVDLANKNKNGKLKRPVFFLLDEFGNFPAIPQFDTMITVSRSRGIRFLTVLQSYAQLEVKYGRTQGEILNANMNTTFYLMTNDQKTANDISHKLGTKTQRETKNGQTYSEGVPLMRPEELMRMEKWKGVTMMGGLHPRRSHTYPEYLFKEKQPEVEVDLGSIQFSETNWQRKAYWNPSKEYEALKVKPVPKEAKSVKPGIIDELIAHETKNRPSSSLKNRAVELADPAEALQNIINEKSTSTITVSKGKAVAAKWVTAAEIEQVKNLEVESVTPREDEKDGNVYVVAPVKKFKKIKDKSND